MHEHGHSICALTYATFGGVSAVGLVLVATAIWLYAMHRDRNFLDPRQDRHRLLLVGGLLIMLFTVPLLGIPALGEWTCR